MLKGATGLPLDTNDVCVCGGVVGGPKAKVEAVRGGKELKFQEREVGNERPGGWNVAKAEVAWIPERNMPNSSAFTQPATNLAGARRTLCPSTHPARIGKQNA